jgi:hypothetical protein
MTKKKKAILTGPTEQKISTLTPEYETIPSFQNVSFENTQDH